MKAGQGAPVRPLHTVSRYECVADQKAAGFPVIKACEVAEVSTSGFYDWCTREAAEPTEPMEGRTPASPHRLPNAIDVYWHPWSE